MVNLEKCYCGTVCKTKFAFVHFSCALVSKEHQWVSQWESYWEVDTPCQRVLVPQNSEVNTKGHHPSRVGTMWDTW